jgi:hypothetical protein
MGTTDHLKDEERFLATLGMTTGDSLGTTEVVPSRKRGEATATRNSGVKSGRYKGPATAVRNR